MPSTRRTLLGALIPTVALVAGCTARGDAPDTGGTDTDPTVHKPRNPAGDAVLVDGDANDLVPLRNRVITSAERVAEIGFTDGVPDSTAAKTRTFLETTDYDTETVFVRHVHTEACRRYRIRSVSWEPGRVEFEYCREYRPPDVACEADRRDAVALCFRLPDTLEDVSSSGSSGRSPCPDGIDYERIDANATVSGEPATLPKSDR
ncbi:MAG: hypothetical protein PPP55_10400 [Halorubrum sp.]